MSPSQVVEPTAIATPSPALPSSPVPAFPQDVSDCCGLFAWLTDHQLLVYRSSASPAGLWLVDIPSGQAQWLDSHMGIPSQAGLIAIPDPIQRVTRIRDAHGNLLTTIANGGVLTWIAPNGKRAAWLERLPAPVQSSSVNPAVRLWVSDLPDNNARVLVTLQAAALTWTADSNAVIARARTLDGQQSGIWRIDVMSGAIHVLVSADFLYNVRLSPSGKWLGYAVGLRPVAAENGFWILDLQNGITDRLPLTRGFRFGSDEIVWVVQPEAEADYAVAYRIGISDPITSMRLPGQVLNDTWEVSPGGTWLAFWRQRDRHVVVLALSAP